MVLKIIIVMIIIIISSLGEGKACVPGLKKKRGVEGIAILKIIIVMIIIISSLG